MAEGNTNCKGFCKTCGRSHQLPAGPAEEEARQLMHLLERHQRIDFQSPLQPGKATTTEYLYGKARGKMFGVLVCETQQGIRQTLKAFSGQYNGMWEVEGWVPPLFNVGQFWELLTPIEKEIKELGRTLQAFAVGTPQYQKLQQKRKKLSQSLMKDIHDLYRLHNFHHKQCSLREVIGAHTGIPTGTGDCCAPKLLNYAAVNKLKPIGLAEFYWGKANPSATRSQGAFYPPCTEKCSPILGFLLCGIDTL